MATFKQVADIQTADMLKLPVPKANFHTEVIQPSELQQEMVRGLAERAEAIRAGGVDPRVDNMLRITNDGRKLALDMRLINPLAADDPNGKVATCARNVIRIWEQTKEQRSAQLVFCDLSTPSKTTPIEMKKNGDGVYEMIPDQFTDVYNDLKKKLMEAGIQEEEIAFIHDANTEARKKELFSKVRSGQVRVLMGSTQKMGAGTNVQYRLIALHDLDCPWRPSDLAQRLGRIVRQGNRNAEVEIFRYVTEGTFDAYLYQLVENKQKFIAQIMTSKAPVRVADDVDETALSYSEIKALATGNPLIIEKCNLDMEVSKLNMLKASYLSQKYSLEDMVLKKYPEAITRLTERIAGYEQDVQLAAAHPKLQEGFVGITILDQPYADKEAAGKAILDVCTKMTGSDAVFLGQYRGFSLVLSYDGPSNEYRMTMKGTLSHTAVLGADVFGNLTRMDNVIDGLSGKLEAVRVELADTQVQLENARTELAAPFAREAELAEKTARLKELNILLNMDEKDNSLIDDVPDEDTVSKILDLVENASSRKSKSEDFIAKFSRIYTPAVCAAALLLALIPPLARIIVMGVTPEWGTWIYRALTFLVISCPCALVISIPLSFFAGIGGASREGILVKGSNYLETLSKSKYIVFDKTGTLTQGVFEVNGIHHNTMEEERLIEYAALAESASSHPISKSLQRAYGKEIDRSRVTDIQEISGNGVIAKVDGMDVAAGNAKLMKRLNIEYKDCRSVGTIIHLAIGGKYAGHIVISDVIKSHSKEAINSLKRSGVEKTIMLTGDAKAVGEQVAATLGIDEVYSELLPGDKVTKVEELLKVKPEYGKLAFVGDGINDAPVLSRADIGIAMGAMGSDAAIEAADVVLMDDDPLKIAKAIRISRKCLRIVRQNTVFAIAVKFICLALGALGIANMWAAIFADVGVMILAILNAIRALFVKKV